MENAIEIRNLTKRFGKNTAVANLDLSIPTGSIFAFLGPNGAGKTTTIKTVMNIMTPTSGSAKILDVDSQKLSPKELMQIGYVSENHDLPLWMTVKQFLAYCKTMYPQWDDQFCQRLLKQFDLPLNKKLRDLSRGMKMKAVLVSSLAYHPKLLILDEPFSGLDPLVRQEFIDGILEITGNREWTIFISSHDIDEVERLADWVGIIDKGHFKVAEKAESLHQRFKKIEFTSDITPAAMPTIPAEWLSFQHKGRAVCFIDSAYEEPASKKKICELFPEASNITVSTLSLKEIFLTLSKQFKMMNL